MTTKTIEEQMTKRMNDGFFFKQFIEPRSFGEDTKAVIRFVEMFTKENFINFVETKSYDYKIDFSKRVILGPRPLTEKELVVFVYFVVCMLMRTASPKIATWVVKEVLKGYEAPDSKSFSVAQKTITSKI